METFHNLILPGTRWSAWFKNPDFNPFDLIVKIIVMALACYGVLLLLEPHVTYAAIARLPGQDASDKLEAAGTLLKLLDTALFKWGARIFAGICIMSSAWALKEQRFGIAIICVIGAIVFGTAPKWVKNIFDINDEQSLFAKVSEPETKRHA